MNERPPTQEEVQRVRAEECRLGGHSYTEIEQFQVDGPIAVVCTNCGKSWGVVNPAAQPSSCESVR